jgi:hypothetical protein
VPITIGAKPITEIKESVDLFAGGGSPSLFEGVTSRFQKVFKVVSIDSDLEKFILKIKNISDQDLNGVTIKVSGLQAGLFETAPILTGFNLWKKGEEKEILYDTKQDITALVSLIEDNEQKTIRIQSPVSTDFF